MDATILNAAVLVALVSAALGLALGRYIWPSSDSNIVSSLVLAQAEVSRLGNECNVLQQQARNHEIERKSQEDKVSDARAEIARLNERAGNFSKQVQELADALQNAEDQRETALTECRLAASEVAQLREREAALTDKIKEQAAQLAEMQKQLTTEFENIANRILKASAAELSESSEKTLTAILDPLRERIHEFQIKVEATYNAETREVLSLKEQIRLMVETSNTIGNQADGLAKALRGDSQILGRWGEVALERILETAGLQEGREYVSQGRGLQPKNEAGGSQKPDIVVMLPEKRTIVIDSKVPLASYERLIAANEEAEVLSCRSQFVRDVKLHIDGLSAKRYQENDKLHAHDCVLMFVPIEGALAAALTSEPNLFSYAWDRQVVLVGPPTLLMTMRTVASIWRYEAQAQNAQDIARLAGELCDKVSSSLEDFNVVTEKMTAALSAHNGAIRRLSTGKGNALSIGERMRSLGVKTKKTIPAMIIDGISTSSMSQEPDEGEIRLPGTDAATGQAPAL